MQATSFNYQTYCYEKLCSDFTKEEMEQIGRAILLLNSKHTYLMLDTYDAGLHWEAQEDGEASAESAKARYRFLLACKELVSDPALA